MVFLFFVGKLRELHLPKKLLSFAPGWDINFAPEILKNLLDVIKIIEYHSS